MAGHAARTCTPSSAPAAVGAHALLQLSANQQLLLAILGLNVQLDNLQQFQSTRSIFF